MKRTLKHANDDPTMTLMVLQHADVYDEHTRSTTIHFRRSFPTAECTNVTLPTDQRSDFSLLAVFAAQSLSEDMLMSNALLTQLRTDVISYVEALETLATKATTASLQDLLDKNIELRDLRDSCFASVFGNDPLPTRPIENDEPSKQRSQNSIESSNRAALAAEKNVLSYLWNVELEILSVL